MHTRSHGRRASSYSFRAIYTTTAVTVPSHNVQYQVFPQLRKATQRERSTTSDLGGQVQHPRFEAPFAFAFSNTMEDIAIIGFSLRFPQDAVSPQSFWNMLVEGRSAVSEVPEDRFNINAFYHPNPDRLDSVSARFCSYIITITAAI